MFIYKVTDKTNGKLYIGMTKDTIANRWSQHISLKYSGATLLKFAINKRGASSFTIEQIDSASSIKELKEKEIFWIKTLNTQRPNGYNIQPGGIGGRNEESVLAHEIPVKCTTTGENFRSIMAASLKLNVGHSKVAAVCAGRRDSTGGLAFEYLDSEKRIRADEKRAYRKDEARLRNKRSLSGKIGAKKRFKKVRCIETGIVFESIAETARIMGLWRPNIVKNLRGKHKSVQGYTFELA
jgi:group I intron endonuclease